MTYPVHGWVATPVRPGGHPDRHCAIAADNSKEAAELRAFLVKLSGRQMRHKKEFTNPALLAGLWVFLSMLEIMEAYSKEELDSLKATAQQFLGKVV